MCAFNKRRELYCGYLTTAYLFVFLFFLYFVVRVRCHREKFTFAMFLVAVSNISNVTVMDLKFLPRSIHEKAVRLSVCLSNAWFVTKRKKVVPTFLYHMKYHPSSFSDKKNG